MVGNDDRQKFSTIPIKAYPVVLCPHHLVYYSVFKKNLWNRLKVFLPCLIGLLILIFFGYCMLGTSYAGALESNRPVTAKSLNRENEHQGLKKHILVITSQPYVTDWFTDLNDSLRKCLFSFLSPESKLSYEYIGSESLTDPEYNKELIDWLKKKYAHITFDMVIAVMPTSCQLLLDYGQGLFPGIPVIYFLPSKEQIPRPRVRGEG